MDTKTSFYNSPNISFLIFHITLNTIQFFFHFTFSLILFVIIIVSLSSPIAIYLSSFSSLSLFTQIKLATTTKIKTNQPPPLRIHHHHHNHQLYQPSTNLYQTLSKPRAIPNQKPQLTTTTTIKITTTPNQPTIAIHHLID